MPNGYGKNRNYRGGTYIPGSNKPAAPAGYSDYRLAALADAGLEFDNDVVTQSPSSSAPVGLAGAYGYNDYRAAALDDAFAVYSEPRVTSRPAPAAPRSTTPVSAPVPAPVPVDTNPVEPAAPSFAEILAGIEAEERAKNNAILDELARNNQAAIDRYALMVEEQLGGPIDTSALDERLAFQIADLDNRGIAAQAGVRQAYADAGIDSQRLIEEIEMQQIEDAARTQALYQAASRELQDGNSAAAQRYAETYGYNRGVGGAAVDAANALVSQGAYAAADVENRANAQTQFIRNLAATYDRDAADQAAAVQRIVAGGQNELRDNYLGRIAELEATRESQRLESANRIAELSLAGQQDLAQMAAELQMTPNEIDEYLTMIQLDELAAARGGGNAGNIEIDLDAYKAFPKSSLVFDFKAAGDDGPATQVRLMPPVVQGAAATAAEIYKEKLAEGVAKTTAQNLATVELEKMLRNQLSTATAAQGKNPADPYFDANLIQLANDLLFGENAVVSGIGS